MKQVKELMILLERLLWMVEENMCIDYYHLYLLLLLLEIEVMNEKMSHKVPSMYSLDDTMDADDDIPLKNDDDDESLLINIRGYIHIDDFVDYHYYWHY
jgi:hypothetical protein